MQQMTSSGDGVIGTVERINDNERSPAQMRRLADVWDDTVDLRHLCLALVICVILALAGFQLAQLFIAPHAASEQLGRAYSMLGGIVLSLAGGALCSMLFAPKRIVVGHATEADSPERVIREIQRDRGCSLNPDDLSCETAAELRTAGLYDLFAQADAGHGTLTARSGK